MEDTSSHVTAIIEVLNILLNDLNNAKPFPEAVLFKPYTPPKNGKTYAFLYIKTEDFANQLKLAFAAVNAMVIKDTRNGSTRWMVKIPKIKDLTTLEIANMRRDLKNYIDNFHRIVTNAKFVSHLEENKNITFNLLQSDVYDKVNLKNQSDTQLALTLDTNGNLINELTDPESDLGGISALHITSMHTDVTYAKKTAQWLLDHGADINTQAKGKDEGETALLYALGRHNYEMAEFFILNGADVNLTSTAGKMAYWSPLMITADDGKENLVKLILQKGGLVDYHPLQGKDEGTTAIYLAAYEGHTDIVDLLIKAGATKKLGESLIIATRCNHVGVVNLLIEKLSVNFAPTEGSNKGVPIIALAANDGHIDVVKCLLNAGASEKLHLALQLAERNKHLEIANLLKEHIKKHTDKTVISSLIQHKERETRAETKSNPIPGSEPENKETNKLAT